MKRFIFAAIFFLSAHFLKSQTTKNLPFQAGEKLDYVMAYGFFPGGTASLELEETTLNNKKVFHCKTVGKTVGLADKIFKVYDVYESYFDTETCLPVKAIRNVSEGATYKKYTEDFFDHEKLTVTNNLNEKKTIKKNTFDVISAFYYARCTVFEGLKEGNVIRIETFFQDKQWTLVVRFKGYETIKIPNFGKIECLKFKPIVETGTFEDEDALDIWISNDQNHIPVRIEMDFFVGSFRTDLVKYSGLKHSLNFK